MMYLLYLVHTLIYIMDIYQTPNFTKYFHMIFIIIVKYYSVMSYFPYVICVRRQDIILLFRQCFLVHYYSPIPFHIREGALECQLPIKCSENKRFRKIKNTSIAVQVCTFKAREEFLSRTHALARVNINLNQNRNSSTYRCISLVTPRK